MTTRKAWLALVLSAVAGSRVVAEDPNACDVAGEAPDLLLGDIPAIARWGTLDGKTAFSLGPTTCNLGTCQGDYAASTSHHPVTAPNMFRLRGGRFEQIGQGWVFHGFFALSGPVCSTDCVPTSGSHLGVHCSTTDTTSYAGFQPNLGPRSDVDASTGMFPFPSTGRGEMGNVLFRRLQVDNDDLDPAQNAGAIYVVEGELVSEDDAAGGKVGNNASWRAATVAGVLPNLSVTLVGSTRPEQPAILAWRESDPFVTIKMVSTPDGIVAVGSRATDLGGGWWHYEYAVQNLTSHRSVGSFKVPLPGGAQVTNAGFHDVDYHSGEPYDLTDWPAAVGSDGITWATTPYGVNPNANALRWGTLYNFRFDVDVPPDPAGAATLGLFRPGLPATFTAAVVAPRACAGVPALVEGNCADGVDEDCDGARDCADADCCDAASCVGTDADGDGFALCDCDDGDPALWAVPGEVPDLTLSSAELHWLPPPAPGALSVTYQVLRASAPASFAEQATCLADPDASDLDASDDEVPSPGGLRAYLVRAVNACPFGQGALGRASSNVPRRGPDCP